MTKKKTNLEKILEYTGPNFMGNPTFGGTGNYGVGGYKQLAHFGLNPATEDIKEKTEEELEQNIEDQEWINGKGLIGRAFKDTVPHWNGRNGAVETVAENAAFDNSTSRMRDLPGFPAPNTLVEPKQFVPLNAGAEYENQIDGRKVEYLGPTINGVPMDDITGNSSALALQLSEDEEEPIGKRIKNIKTIDQKLNKLIGPDPDLSSDTEHEHDASEIVLYNLVEEVVNQYLMELLGAPKATTPDRLGWNNTRTNSLAAWRNHLNPDQPPTETWRPQFGENEEQNPSVDYVPAQRSPLSGFGAIGWPKQFIPQDYEVVNPNYETFAEDPLGARRLRQSPTDDDRVGVNASIREAHMKKLEALLEYLLSEEEILEEGIDEGENAPTNPSLWSRAKAAARAKFDVYPSAYANAWASKWYKGKGGGWRKKGKKK